jgi:hypothetical protein
MEQLGDLLRNRAMPEMPDEIAAAKKFVAEQFNASCTVSLQGNNLIITVQSAALASMLRLRTLQLRAACKTTKRLVLRIA